jgi:glycosyltransferase involved in cell wall biosynthesis
MNIKHTILMITYNQEDYIREALECLFRQGVLPYEVFIADDCSVDGTRKIITEFQEKYPNIIKPIFHKENLGINQNLNYIIDNVKVNGDIINFLSGDDLYKDNMLLTFNEFIKDNKLFPKNEKFLLMTNTLNLFSDGKILEDLNNYKLKNKNHLKLKLRNRMGNRNTGISRALYESFPLYNLDIGLWADALHSFDMHSLCDKLYFIDQSFPIYRIGSGVTSKLQKSIFAKSWIKVASYFLKNRKNKLDYLDQIFLKKSIKQSEIYLNINIENKVKFIPWYFLSFLDVLGGYCSFKTFIFESSILFPKYFIKKIKSLIKVG